MTLTLNLQKSTNSLKLCLQKAGIVTPPELEVGFAMDVSGSFEDEHRAGLTDKLLTRLVPWGLVFDPDRKLDLFTFSDGASHVQDVGPVDANNYDGFIPNRVVGKVVGWNGGTTYSHVIDRMLGHFGWAGDTVKKAGFFGRMMGQKDTVVAGAKKRSLVIIATDGDNNDHEKTRAVLRASEARGDKVYFLFLGISNGGSRFPFLDRVGDEFSNTGFVHIKDLNAFINASDDDVNQMLISDELLAWFANSTK